MKEPKITESELFAELDKLRVPKAPPIPDNIMKLIHYARSKEPRVEWKDLLAYLKSKFGIDIKLTTLRARYDFWKNK